MELPPLFFEPQWQRATASSRSALVGVPNRPLAGLRELAAPGWETAELGSKVALVATVVAQCVAVVVAIVGATGGLAR